MRTDSLIPAAQIWAMAMEKKPKRRLPPISKGGVFVQLERAALLSFLEDLVSVYSRNFVGSKPRRKISDDQLRQFGLELHTAVGMALMSGNEFRTDRERIDLERDQHKLLGKLIDCFDDVLASGLFDPRSDLMLRAKNLAVERSYRMFGSEYAFQTERKYLSFMSYKLDDLSFELSLIHDTIDGVIFLEHPCEGTRGKDNSRSYQLARYMVSTWRKATGKSWPRNKGDANFNLEIVAHVNSRLIQPLASWRGLDDVKSCIITSASLDDAILDDRNDVNVPKNPHEKLAEIRRDLGIPQTAK